MEFTKGEWNIWHTQNVGDIIQTTKRQIANVVQGNQWDDKDKQEAEANARLISAAPEMYEAGNTMYYAMLQLQKVYPRLFNTLNPEEQKAWEMFRDSMAKWENVRAKAEGK